MPKQASQVEAQSISRSGGGSVHSSLLSYSQMLQQDLARNRFAEEREWYECALFYQRRQWLKWDNSNRRWSLVKQDPAKPRPMPVTNHYARTVNATANQLSSGRVKINAVPTDDSNTNRRAAEFGEMAIRAIDKETQFDQLVPLLGKHATLWGMGVTKDYYDTSLSNGTVRVPQISVQQITSLGCYGCGQVSDLGPVMMANAGAGSPPCPNCGSTTTETWPTLKPVVNEVKQFSKGKLCTQVVPIFEVFVPRDCQNPNLARKLQHRYRMPLGEVKRLWGDKAQNLKADTKLEIHEIYLEALRSLVNYNYMHDQTAESVTVTETWAQFDQLPEDLQETLREAVLAQDTGDEEDDDGDEPADRGDGFSSAPDDGGRADQSPERDGGADSSDAVRGATDDSDEQTSDLFEAPDGELDPIEQLEQWGIYCVEAGGVVLDWGISPLEGDNPFTFYLWELDPANVYCKGLGVDLVPLQKRLNRLDSLMELSVMSNAAGKWLVPNAQGGNIRGLNGSPSEVIEYDNIGDGKVKPEFVLPTPFHPACFSLRAAILLDFQQIGMTQGIQQGANPQGVTAFRGLAYLGAKADEQISTQRFLWETAHALRYKKALTLARKNWTEERKVKVAGFNGRWGMKQLFGRDLEGEYILEIQPDSSRPKTLAEKEQAFQLLLEGGLIDPTDSQTREYIISELANLDKVNLVSHLQYLKAERDLDTVLEGQMPIPNLNVDVQIQLKIFTEFTLTEEFEGIAPEAQQMVNIYIQTLQAAAQAQMQAQVAAVAEAAAPPIAQKLAGAMQKKQGKQKTDGMDGVPGVNISPEGAGQGAEAEGASLAAGLP